ncbi:MAG: hypothetical protein PHW76_04230 [Alphaproteobacteria bacterium]|nr:hypothetical protein [Alphaproteobacteria bacterium]
MTKDISTTGNDPGDTQSQKPSWMDGYASAAKEPALSANQSTSIAAMIAFISNKSGQSEFCLERKLSDRFNVPNPKFLAAADFDKAIQYLADIITE